jgi:hypothetical protein
MYMILVVFFLDVLYFIKNPRVATAGKVPVPSPAFSCVHNYKVLNDDDQKLARIFRTDAESVRMRLRSQCFGIRKNIVDKQSGVTGDYYPPNIFTGGVIIA